jgi:hypothetical protein
VEDVALASGELGALPEGPDRPVKVPTWIRSSSRRSSGQGVLAGVLGGAGQEQGEPAEDDVSADAFFLVMAILARLRAHISAQFRRQ